MERNFFFNTPKALLMDFYQPSCFGAKKQSKVVVGSFMVARKHDKDGYIPSTK
jgi:hypothetical protein